MRRLSLIAGIAWALTVPAIAQEGRASISSIESLIRGRQYDQALTALKADLRSDPGDHKLWTLEGVCLGLQGNDAEALAAFDHAIRISPDYTPALKGAVQILYKTGDRRAIPLLERMLKSEPNDATAHEMLGMIEKRSGDCHAAASQFALIKDTIDSHPDSLEAYGYCLVKLDRDSDAVPVFRELIPLRPGQTYPSYDLAFVLVASHSNDEAVKVLEPLLTADQADPDILSLASEAYEATGNTPKAVELARRAIVAEPTEPSNYVYFAALCLNHDSYQVGIDMIDAGLRHIPNDSSLYLSRGVFNVQLGNYDKAEADFKLAEQLDSGHAIASYAADMAILQKNDPETALVQVRAHLKAHPESPLLHLMLAQLLMNKTPSPQSAAFKEAMQAAMSAERSKPDLVDAHNLLASMYMTLDEYDRAIKESRLALEYDPSNETALYRLILALRHSGQSQDLQPLVKRLSELHQESMRHETDRKKYRLVEQGAAGTPTDAAH